MSIIKDDLTWFPKNVHVCGMQDCPVVSQQVVFVATAQSLLWFSAFYYYICQQSLGAFMNYMVVSDMNSIQLGRQQYSVGWRRAIIWSGDSLLWVKEMQWKAKMDITSRISFYIDNMTKHFGFLVTSYDKMHLLFWKCLIWEMYQGDWEKTVNQLTGNHSY